MKWPFFPAHLCRFATTALVDENTSKMSTSDIHADLWSPGCAVIQKLGHAPCRNGTFARISKYPYLNAILSRVETPRGSICGFPGSPDGTTRRCRQPSSTRAVRESLV